MCQASGQHAAGLAGAAHQPALSWDTCHTAGNRFSSAATAERPAGLTHEDLEYLCCQLQQHAGTWGRLQVLSLGPPAQQQEQAASQDGAWSNAAFAQLCSAAARLPSLAVLEVRPALQTGSCAVWPTPQHSSGP